MKQKKIEIKKGEKRFESDNGKNYIHLSWLEYDKDQSKAKNTLERKEYKISQPFPWFWTFVIYYETRVLEMIYGTFG